MVFYFREKNNDIYFGFFLSPLGADIKPREPREGGKEGTPPRAMLFQ
jgi:hypothetical protein